VVRFALDSQTDWAYVFQITDNGSARRRWLRDPSRSRLYGKKGARIIPRYYFVLHGPNNETHDDLGGTDFPDKLGALSYGMRVIRELKEAGGYDDAGWTMVVKDGGGGEIMSLPFADPERSH